MILFVVTVAALGGLSHLIGTTLESREVLAFRTETVCLFYYVGAFVWVMRPFYQGQIDAFPMAPCLAILVVMIVHARYFAEKSSDRKE